ncbi:MAG TPA: IS4 family transposase [Steroidobacteraceae bacterium]|jgi:hypothetical protein
MHARGILQKCFADVFLKMHAARVRVLMNAVLALLRCRRLVLIELARAWPGAQKVRAPLKQLDRLLSNPHLHAELKLLYERIIRLSVRSDEPVIVVDWSVLKPDESWHLLRAALAVGGRALTLYEEIHPQRRAQSPKVHRAFLRRLHALLPRHCCPIIVTDAGFRCPWFAEVEALGWRWVGRVRNQVCVRMGEHQPWRLTSLLLKGSQKLQCFGAVELARNWSLHCQLLRYRQDLQGRKHRTARGLICRKNDSRAIARSHREPWLLAYCNALQDAEPMHIVNLYRKRMQIEQSFRDLKSARHGCAFRYSLTRKGPRLAVLLLLHALASLLAWLQGCALWCERHTAHCTIRANTKRACYSLVRIGWESLRNTPVVSPLLHRFSSHHLPPWLSSQLQGGC